MPRCCRVSCSLPLLFVRSVQELSRHRAPRRQTYHSEISFVAMWAEWEPPPSFVDHLYEKDQLGHETPPKWRERHQAAA